ncbi:MAG TPA: hypothetical protein VF746_22570 [Longimicrobium sp.]|jgi:hypothetical protein
MRGIRRTVSAGLLGLTVAGALGFGAAQALAAPASPTAAGRAACDPLYCLDLCGPEWYCEKNGTCHCGG